MVLVLGLVVVLGPVKVVPVVCTQVPEAEVEVVEVATMVALGMVVDLVRAQALANTLKAHIMAMVGILTLVVMEVAVAEGKLVVAMGPVAKVVVAEPVPALAKLVDTGMVRVMQMLMPMATVKEKAPARMVVVAAAKVVDPAMVTRTLRSFTSKKMEPNLWCFRCCIRISFYLYHYACAKCMKVIKGSFVVQVNTKICTHWLAYLILCAWWEIETILSLTPRAYPPSTYFYLSFYRILRQIA